MNYIKEINSFYDWLETNSVSDSSINLWHALLHINNKASNNDEWKQEFTVAISTLMLKTSLSKSSIIRARNQLKQFGRIDFRERKGNQSAVYSLFAFHTDTQSATQSVTQTDTQSVTQTDTQCDTINKLNKTKLNNNVLLKKEPKEKQDFNFKNELLKIADKKLVEDWLAVRKTKKATNSETSFLNFIKEVEKSEKKINEILEICVKKDWKGFEASWIKNLDHQKNNQNGRIYEQNRNR